MTGRAGDWGDERLAAAFAARATATPTAPPDLSAAILERVAADRGRTAARPWAILAAAAAIVAVVGVGGIATALLANRPSTAASPTPSASGAIADAARELELVPIGVADAVAIHDATPDDREMLVSGYLSNDPGPVTDHTPVVGSDCDLAFDAGSHLLAPRCWPLLMANPESIVTRTLNDVTVHVPQGPAIHPVFDLTFLPSTPEVPLVGNAVPTAVTVVGHFGDRRAASCPIGAEAACGTSFLVDRVVEVDGVAVGIAPVLDPGRADAEQAVRQAVPGVLVVASIRTTPADLPALEPSFVDPTAIPEALDGPAIRLIQALPAPDGSGAPRSVRTFLVADGRGIVVEMTAAGPVVREPAPGPLPPDLGAIVGDPLTVSQALALRANGVDDREIAVAGFLSDVPVLACPFVPADPNPTAIRCPESFQWLMERAETLWTTTGDVTAGGPPSGPAIHPSFALVGQPLSPRGDRATGSVSVVLVGHFDDRRAALCPAGEAPETSCADTFVVDRVARFGDVARPATTRLDNDRFDETTRLMVTVAPTATETQVDELVAAVAPGEAVLSRQLVTGERLAAVEPGLRGDTALTGQRLLWLVTTAVRTDGRSTAHTFLVVDGTNAVIGVTAQGPIARPVVGTSQPSAPTGADAFDGAPTSVLGLAIATVPTTLQLHPQHDAAEVAVRGWYVPPDPAAACPGLRDPVRPIGIPCSQGRHWLLDRPEQLWADPQKVDLDRQPTGFYLNPIIPVDVPFAAPDTWADGTPDPWPVVVLGHFSDPRVRTYAANAEFVVDALVWQAGAGPSPADPGQAPVVRLAPASDAPQAVLARVEAQLGPARATWLTVLRGADLAIMDPEVADADTELARSPAVWVARRLVDLTEAGVTRGVVTTAFTADGSDRIWDRSGCCLALRTTIDLELSAVGGSPAGLLNVADQSATIVSARVDPGTSIRGWRRIGPADGPLREVAATDRPEELAYRFEIGQCDPPLRLTYTSNAWIGLSLGPDATCRPGPAERYTIILTFDHPIDVGLVHTDDVLSGG